MKIAFSGASGSGKTTLVEWLVKHLNENGHPNVRHISGSAGDVKKPIDKLYIDELYDYPGGSHSGVIRFSALNPEYGIANQRILQQRRQEIIMENDDFVTDRSPVDNLTYFVNQVGFHPMVTDEMTAMHANACLEAWDELDVVIYIESVQPTEVERNGNRIANKWYQKAIDAQFKYWITNFFQKNSISGPSVLIIDYWDLETRKENIIKFLKENNLI